MEDERILNTVLQGKVEGARRKGKPRTTWMSAIEERHGFKLPRATKLVQDIDCWSLCQTDST